LARVFGIYFADAQLITAPVSPPITVLQPGNNANDPNARIIIPASVGNSLVTLFPPTNTSFTIDTATGIITLPRGNGCYLVTLEVNGTILSGSSNPMFALAVETSTNVFTIVSTSILPVSTFTVFFNASTTFVLNFTTNNPTIRLAVVAFPGQNDVSGNNGTNLFLNLESLFALKAHFIPCA
jgi:hypothetical protein